MRKGSINKNVSAKEKGNQPVIVEITVLGTDAILSVMKSAKPVENIEQTWTRTETANKQRITLKYVGVILFSFANMLLILLSDLIIIYVVFL